jgi:hypothetical protein
LGSSNEHHEDDEAKALNRDAQAGWPHGQYRCY